MPHHSDQSFQEQQELASRTTKKVKFSEHSPGMKQHVKCAESWRIDRAMSKVNGELIIRKSISKYFQTFLGRISF